MSTMVRLMPNENAPPKASVPKPKSNVAHHTIDQRCATSRIPMAKQPFGTQGVPGTGQNLKVGAHDVRFAPKVRRLERLAKDPEEGQQV